MPTISVCYGCGEEVSDSDWERLPFHKIDNAGDVAEWREQRLHCCGAMLSTRVSEIAFGRPSPYSTSTHLAMLELDQKLQGRRLLQLGVIELPVCFEHTEAA